MVPVIEAATPPPGSDRSATLPSRTPMTAQQISHLSMADVLARMEPRRAATGLALIEWLCGPGKQQPTGLVVEELCTRLLDAGLPLDRYGSSTSMITADHDAIGRIWRRDKGVEETVYTSPGEEDEDYLRSPFYAAAQTRQVVDLFLPDTPDDLFGVVPVFKASGLVQYLCFPMWLTNGANGWVTFATKHPTGFSQQDLLTIALVTPALMARIDSRVGWTTLDKLLRTYVGDEPHNAILAGRAKRGQVSTIRAAMLVADLRDSTGHTVDLSAVQTVDLFNALFDCLVPPVEARSGEVLKYLGDGLLAIFRENPAAPASATDRAFEAAEAELDAIAAWNHAHPMHRPMQIGVALHYGEIAYGNIGSGSRLDFTVIGQDVGLATRIAGMNRPLGQPLLLSAPFAARLSVPATRIGLFPARGFPAPVEVFRPVDGP